MNPDIIKGIFIGLCIAAAIIGGGAVLAANIFWKGMR